jgi:signal transduction histidine kinase
MDFHKAIGLCVAFAGLFVLPLFPDVIALNGGVERIPLGPHLEYLEDPSGTETIESVRDAVNEGRWQESSDGNLGFGFTSSVFWARFTLRYRESRDIDLLLEHYSTNINSILLFSPEGGGWKTLEIGNRKPFNERPIKYRTLVFPLALHGQSEETFFLRFESDGSMNLGADLWGRDAFQQKIYDEAVLLWMFYGIMLIMIVYNLFILVSVRDITYLYLILQIAFMTLNMMSIQGVSFQYLWPGNAWWASVSTPIFMGASNFAQAQFTRHFIRTMDQKHAVLKFTDKALIAQAWSSLIMILLPLVQGSYHVSIIAATVLIATNSAFTSTMMVIILFIPGSWSRRIKFYLAAFGGFLAGAIMLMLKTYAMLPENILTNYGLQIGIVFEVAILSFALADTINVMRNELVDLNAHLEEKIRDRTEELKSTNEKLLEMDKAKTNLFTNISHEIKTPLTLISNYMDQHIGKYGAGYEIGVVKRNIDKLLSDMVNFFDVLKLERGIDLYDHGAIADLSDILKGRIELFGSMAYGKGITMSSDIDDGLFIEADPVAIERMINNMLENAVRYNKEGGLIHVSLKHGNGDIQLLVKDSGIGIDEAQLPHIFEPYFQINHQKRNIQGIGMGLSIVKRIADSLQASIEVSSEIDAGTTFMLGFREYHVREGDAIIREPPRARIADIAPLPMDSPEAPSSASSPRSVLVVEDNRDLLALMRGRLGERYRVTVARNGREALERLSDMHRPDVIISDIMMDEMDGYQFLERISRMDGYREIPFIFVTAKASKDDRIEGLNMGAIDYIYKPFVMEELVSKVDSILRYQDLKKKVFEKEKFASLGLLLGGISHEIFNPLSGITGPLDNLKKLIANSELASNERVLRYFRCIRESVDKIEGIIGNIRVLCSDKPLAKEKVVVLDAVAPLASEYQERYGGRIRFELHIERDSSILANKDAFGQILGNLIANACDSINGDGVVSVSAERTNGLDRIEIADTGCGISDEDMDRIFDPFYSKKEPGKGVGLGLNIVKNLIMKMNWDITANSRPSAGTIFTIHAKD